MDDNDNDIDIEISDLKLPTIKELIQDKVNEANDILMKEEQREFFDHNLTKRTRE